MKKILAMVLVLALCLSLCACGDPVTKLEKQVIKDINEHFSSAEQIDVTVGNTKVDGEYYYISGRITMQMYLLYDHRYSSGTAKFEGKYRLSGGTFTKVYLNFDEKWN